jgi:hypothetical protein
MIEDFLIEDLEEEELESIYYSEDIYNDKFEKFLPDDYSDLWKETFKDKREAELVKL